MGVKSIHKYLPIHSWRNSASTRHATKNQARVVCAASSHTTQTVGVFNKSARHRHNEQRRTTEWQRRRPVRLPLNSYNRCSILTLHAHETAQFPSSRASSSSLSQISPLNRNVSRSRRPQSFPELAGKGNDIIINACIFLVDVFLESPCLALHIYIYVCMYLHRITRNTRVWVVSDDNGNGEVATWNSVGTLVKHLLQKHCT